MFILKISVLWTVHCFSVLHVYSVSALFPFLINNFWQNGCSVCTEMWWSHCFVYTRTWKIFQRSKVKSWSSCSVQITSSRPLRCVESYGGKKVGKKGHVIGFWLHFIHKLNHFYFPHFFPLMPFCCYSQYVFLAFYLP